MFRLAITRCHPERSLPQAGVVEGSQPPKLSNPAHFPEPASRIVSLLLPRPLIPFLSTPFRPIRMIVKLVLDKTTYSCYPCLCLFASILALSHLSYSFAKFHYPIPILELISTFAIPLLFNILQNATFLTLFFSQP